MLVFAPDARATDAEFTSDTAAQFYDVRSPTGETILMRRRLTTTLGVSAYDLLKTPPGDPKAADISLRARLRYDADYGASGATADPTSPGSRNSFVPGFSQGAVDLMYAYVEGRRLLKGWLGFKLGRQYVTDALGWWSFDGGAMSLTTPYFARLEAYAGFEQRGGMPLSNARFEADGIWRGNRSNFDPTVRDLYSSFQPSAAAPAFGAALESTGFTWLHGRLSYRRVYNTGPSNVTAFTSGLYAPAQYDGWRISSDRLGYAIDATWSGVGGAKGGIVYDFYRTDVTQAYASIEGYLGSKVTIGVDYDYYVPSFDGDSIWNFFAGEPMNDISVRANVDVDRRLSVAGGAHVRVFTVQTAAYSPTSSSPPPSLNYVPLATYFPTSAQGFDEGGNLSLRWRTGETAFGVRGSGNFGKDDGDRVGADVSCEHVFETRYVVSGRAGVWQWNDKIRPDRDATSVNYVAGIGYRFASRAQAMVEWQHDINRLVGQRFRVMAWLTLAVMK
ncbi:MAG: hypothetical protein M3O46_23435 [Myxococcota bacterium]|nr:hypothetical protein [Myxococcota bacterium]